jgi:hypothetical protein
MTAPRSNRLVSIYRVAIMFAVAAQPTVAIAQVDATASPRSAAALVAAWPSANRIEILALLDSAAIAGLPVAPLRAKIAEGIAKDAAPATIVNVVRALENGLRTVRRTLGPRLTDPELVAAVAAVQSGATLDQLRALSASIRPERASTQMFVVLTDLTRRGVAATECVTALARLARAGAGDAAFAQLRVDVANDVSTGVAARAAVSRRADEYVSRGFLPSGAIFPPPEQDDR